MALIKCGECGNEVSDKAAACQKCGNPISPPAQRAPLFPETGPSGEPVKIADANPYITVERIGAVVTMIGVVSCGISEGQGIGAVIPVIGFIMFMIGRFGR